MTKRAVFNTAAKHLLTQNCKSKGDLGCMYRGNKGTSCAVGVLIPDELYDRSMEGGFSTLIKKIDHKYCGNKIAKDLVNLFNKHEPLLFRLQLIHDNILPEEWRTALDKLAKEEKIIRPEY